MAVVLETAEAREARRARGRRLVATFTAIAIAAVWLETLLLGSGRARVVVIGDSITVDSARDIAGDLHGDFAVEVRAHGGRRIDQMLPSVAAAARADPYAIVVNLGTNDVIQAASHPDWRTGFTSLITSLSETRCGVLITVNSHADFFAGRPVAEAIDRAIAQAAASHPNLHVLDWNAIVHQADGARLLLSDGIHPSPLGASLLAQNISRAVTDDCTVSRPPIR